VDTRDVFHTTLKILDIIMEVSFAISKTGLFLSYLSMQNIAMKHMFTSEAINSRSISDIELGTIRLPIYFVDSLITLWQFKFPTKR
jgi:hypothetical protein